MTFLEWKIFSAATGCTWVAGQTTLPVRLHSTILYRMGQKKLARQYLQLARSEIASEMICMRALIAEEQALFDQ